MTKLTTKKIISNLQLENAMLKSKVRYLEELHDKKFINGREVLSYDDFENIINKDNWVVVNHETKLR